MKLNSLFVNIVSFTFIFVASFSVSAEESQPSDSTLPISFSAGVGSEFPVGLNADGILHFSKISTYVRAKVGMFLEAYTDQMNSTAESMDFYNSATSDIIAESLKDATYWELAIGWAPNATKGFFAEASYFSVKGEGQVTGATILAALTDSTLPFAGTNLYDIEGEVQSFILRGGYRWPVFAKSTLWLSFGVMAPLDSSTSIDREVAGPVQQALLDAANRELDEYINETLKDDVYIPLIGANWVYNF
jgi:hypothetical protein